MTDYKQLCAELLAALESWSPNGGGPLEDQEAEEEARLIDRARAALAEPEPEGPTDEELRNIWETGHLPTEEELANDDGECDLQFLFTSAYFRWLEENPEAMAQHEAKCLRAVFNAGRNWPQPH